MSQESTGSNGSDISLVMSDGAFQELQSLLEGDIPENVMDGRQEEHFPPSTSGQHLMRDIPSTSQLPPSNIYYSQVPSRQLQAIAPVPFANAPCIKIPLEWIITKEDTPGLYGFEFGFEDEKQPLVKAAPWTYSAKLNKVFARSKVDIPFRLFLRDPPPQEVYRELYLRVFLMYTKSEHSTSVVQRCRNHESDGRKHIMESSNSDSFYGTTLDGYHFLTLPLRYPEHVGQPFVLEFFRFLCLNTCPGGPDRKAFHCVFLLESQGNLVGKRVLDIQICTTPGRDRPKEENKMTRRSQRMPKVKQEPVEPPPPVVQMLPPKNVVKEEDDNEIYTIQVRGRKKYEQLLRVKESQDILSLVPQELLENYRANCPPCGPNWFLEQQQQRQSNIQPSSTITTPSPSTSGLSHETPHSSRYCLERHRKPRKVANSTACTTDTVVVNE